MEQSGGRYGRGQLDGGLIEWQFKGMLPLRSICTQSPMTSHSTCHLMWGFELDKRAPLNKQSPIFLISTSNRTSQGIMKRKADDDLADNPSKRKSSEKVNGTSHFQEGLLQQAKDYQTKYSTSEP